MIYPERTLIFGHRGASAYAPQNTIPAFELAVTQGADGIELDVHLSADGVPVVIHDFTVDHTTNGAGAVHEMTLAQLKQLDAGVKFDPKFAGIPIPTLEEVFQAVGQLFINIEIKADDSGIESAVAALIAKYELTERVAVSSFNPEILRRFSGVMSSVAIGLLYMPEEGFDPRLVLPDLKCEALHPYHEIIDAAYMANAKQQGYTVNTWTVNDPMRAVQLRDLGVNGIITDNPDTIITALKA